MNPLVLVSIGMEGVTGFDVQSKVKHFLEPLEQEISLITDKISRLDNQLFIPKIPEIIGSYEDVINYRKYVESFKRTC